jgi:hypothetical protein
MAKMIHEVLQSVGSTRKKAEKIDILKKNETVALRDVLRGIFDDRVVWTVPDGNPPYTPSEAFNCPANLLREHLKFKYFARTIDGNKLPKFKRERIYMGLLEGIHPSDAEIVVKMVNKEPPKGLTIEVVKEAFPDLLP